MSTEFPNSLYVPTGISLDRDFIKYEGYCYKKVSSNVTLSNQTLRSDIFGDYEDCVDCNSCECPKTIDFIFGGFQYEGTNVTYRETTIPIKTCSTGWQEIALESGFLNGNDENINFKPVQIRCYDRKIDMQSGIFVSFEDRNAEICHFKYITGDDLYEREDLYYHAQTGGYGDIPYWEFKNQYDKVGIANRINTIKFKSLCEVPCNTQDITFRIRGKVSENSSWLNLGADYDNVTSSWVYATCKDVPNTPGQIVECIPSGDGINFTEYFTQNYEGLAGDVGGQIERPGPSPATPNQPEYVVQFVPMSVDLVNMPILLGEIGTSTSKEFSVTGNKHFADYRFGTQSFVDNNVTPLDPNNYFYYALDSAGANFDFAEQIGKRYGVDYNKPIGCMSPAVMNSDFNSYYRHLGGNLLAEQAFAGNQIADIYTGCFQSSEFADGIFKNGTYVPMFWSGIITGDAIAYNSFIDDTEVAPPEFWSTGIYVYQWYKSGDRSNGNDNITGYFGFLTGEFKNESLHRHYKSLLDNHGPVNLGTPLKSWNVQSGNYPLIDAQKLETTFILNFNNNLAYKYAFSPAYNTVRHITDDVYYQTTLSSYYVYYTTNGGPFTNTTQAGTNSITNTKTVLAFTGVKGNPFDNYNFKAIDGNPMMDYLNEPLYATNTFIKPASINELFPLTDSGNPVHDPASSPLQYTSGILTDDIALTELKSIKFQLSWEK